MSTAFGDSYERRPSLGMIFDSFTCDECWKLGWVYLSEDAAVKDIIEVKCWKCHGVTNVKMPYYVPHKQRMNWLKLYFDKVEKERRSVQHDTRRSLVCPQRRTG